MGDNRKQRLINQQTVVSLRSQLVVVDEQEVCYFSKEDILISAR